jgi:hypothetical protein
VATLFHSKEWLDALQRTHGYRARVPTTSGPGERLTNGLAFCHVRSWLTERRLVSVPFSPVVHRWLIAKKNSAVCFLACSRRWIKGGEYLEIRSIAGSTGMSASLSQAATFCIHPPDLRPSLNELYHGFHVNYIRRKITRVQRDHLTYEDGRSEDLLDKSYRFTLLTRRHQEIPPQPLSWF